VEQDRAQRRIAGGAAYATEGSMKRCLETAPLIGATPLVCAAVDEVEFMSDSLKRFLLCCCFASMGCTNDVEPLPASAIVYGTVFSSSGSPIAGAIVSADGFDRSCSGPLLAAASGRESDSAGRYRLLVTGAGADSVCVGVQASALIGGRTTTVTVTGSRVSLRKGAQAFDSVRVDLHFQ